MNRHERVPVTWQAEEAYGASERLQQQLLRAQAAQSSISQLLPYRWADAEDHLFICEDSVGFILLCQPATGIRSDEFRTLEGVFNGPYRPGTALQIQLLARPQGREILQRWRQARTQVVNRTGISTPESGFYQQLADQRYRYLGKGDWQSLFSDESVFLRDYVLLVSLSIPRSPEPAVSVTREERQLLQGYRDYLRSILQASHMPGELVQASLLADLLQDWLIPHRILGDTPVLWSLDAEQPLHEQMIHDEAQVQFTTDHVALSWRQQCVNWVSLSVKQFPEQWSGLANGELIGGFFQTHQAIPCPFSLIMNVLVPDPLQEETLAKTRLMRATQMRDTEVGKYVPAWVQRQTDWFRVQQQMAEGAKMMLMSWQLVAWTQPARRIQTVQSIRSCFERLGWSLVQDKYCLPYRLLAALPLSMGTELQKVSTRLRFWSRMTSVCCAHLAPWMAEWKGNVGLHQEPLLLLAGRRGQLMYLNPYLNRKGNFNIAVAAASGAGKSFLTQDYVLALLSAGGRVFIIDSGGSYRNLCELVQGQYLSFEQGAPVSLDPFALLREDATATLAVQMPLLKTLLATMASPREPLGAKACALLEQGIRTAWQQQPATVNLDVVCSVLAESSQETARDVALMLRPYTSEGMYGHYFSGGQGMDAAQPLVVLELDALSGQPDLQNIILLILMQRITQAMYQGDRQQKKLCIIDEAWRLLGQGHAGAFIEEGYRTARKFGGAFMTITQGLPDYFRNQTTMACYANSDYVFMLRQKLESVAQAKAEGHLIISDWEERLLRSLTTVAGKYSEVAIRSPEGWAVGRLMVDAWTEKLMSTRAEDVALLQEYLRQGMSRSEAISKLAGETNV